MPEVKKQIGIDEYKTLVFDCDGVILNSNQVKTDAFYSVALPYGQKAADDLVKYHLDHGGISRYQKIEYFLQQIVGIDGDHEKSQKLLMDFATEVKTALLGCEVARGLTKLRNLFRQSTWLIVSGGDQDELRDVFSKRGLSNLFNGGIYGSPDSKDEILFREIESGNITKPALYFGDSRYDYEAASNAGLDFIFVSGWTEFKEWRSYFGEAVKQLPSLEELSVLDERLKNSS